MPVLNSLAKHRHLCLYQYVAVQRLASRYPSYSDETESHHPSNRLSGLREIQYLATDSEAMQVDVPVDELLQVLVDELLQVDADGALVLDLAVPSHYGV